MKVIPEEHTIELTRRNLLSLLAKLDGNPPNSACTIGEPIGAAGSFERPMWFVKAVEDVEHYADRPPGPMVEETERALDAYVENNPEAVDD
jgi:hypothetical protein